MTQEEAKDYVMTHLPCTVTGVVAIFDEYFKGIVQLSKLVGMASKTLGYTTLVFHLSYPADAVGEIHPAKKLGQLQDCFAWWCRKYDFKIGRTSFDHRTLQYIYWVTPPVEIKEDRK